MKDYRETMKDLSFTQEQKEAMVEGLMAAAQPAKRQVSHRRILAIAAAAAMLTLTVTTGATGVLPSPPGCFLLPLWRGSRPDRDHRPDRPSHRGQRHRRRRYHHSRRHPWRHP